MAAQRGGTPSGAADRDVAPSQREEGGSRFIEPQTPPARLRDTATRRRGPRREHVKVMEDSI
jgi:hypothetical protein